LLENHKGNFTCLATKTKNLAYIFLGRGNAYWGLGISCVSKHLASSGGVNKQAIRYLNINQGGRIYANSAASIVASFGSSPLKGVDKGKEAFVPIGEVLIGEMTPLEKAIVQSRDNNKRVMLAQATIEGVRVEGIGTNLAVLRYITFLSREAITWMRYFPLFCC
jgi:hypothetical protein